MGKISEGQSWLGEKLRQKIHRESLRAHGISCSHDRKINFNYTALKYPSFSHFENLRRQILMTLRLCSTSLYLMQVHDLMQETQNI